MSLPEISRRCRSCGAAVRVGARFCPQCGQPFEAEAEAPVVEERRDETARAAAVPTNGEWSPREQSAPTTKDHPPPTKDFPAFEQSPVLNETPTPPAEQVSPAPSEVEVEPSSSAGAPESLGEASAASEEAGRAGEPRGRVARVREGTRARVGRMREEAIVALEETPDDSGLRFVLAAAALFILFLVLLFLSTTLLR